MRIQRACFVLVPAALLSLAGCPQPPADDRLSDSQADALAGGTRAAGLLAQAVTSARNAAAFGISGGTSQPLQDVTFGTCPVVTIDIETGQPTFTVAVDFGAGCSPANNVTCAGNVQATINAPAAHVNVIFNSLGCNEIQVAGTIDADFALTQFGGSLDGFWNLSGQDGRGAAEINCEGTANYDVSSDTATLTNLLGSLVAGGVMYTAFFEDIQVSLGTYGNFTPFGGSIVVTGAAVEGTMTVTYNAQSPVTGEVQVSLNGMAPFTVNLESFEQQQ